MSAVFSSWASLAWRASSAAVPRARPSPIAAAYLRMQPDPLAGQQVVVDGLAEQGVTKGVVPVAGDQDVALDGCAQALVEGGVADVGGDRQQLVGDPATGDAGRADDLARGLVEPVEPDQQHLGEVGRQRVVVGAGGGADQLLDEEGVAFGALDDHVDLVVGEHGAPDP